MSAITNRSRAAQLIDFDDMRYGKMMPTDLDALLDMKGKGFVAIECKFGKARLPFGQRLALERLVDALAKGGQKAMLLVARHNRKVTQDVMLGACKVDTYYYEGNWVNMDDDEATVRKFIDTLIDYWEIPNMPKDFN